MKQIIGLFWTILDVIQRYPMIILFFIFGGGLIITVIFSIIKKQKKSPEDHSMDSIPYEPKTCKPKKDYKGALQFISIGVILSSAIILLGITSEGGSKERPIKKNSKYTFGIDISHYQGKVNWNKLKTSKHPIEYIIVRSSMGSNGIDTQFDTNWEMAKKVGYIRGAYHYFRPNEDAETQFNNFKKKVILQPGDLPPILDIEKQSKNGNTHLVKEVKRWLTLAEEYYGVTPILYTGRTFYVTYLKNQISDYPLWIAAYSGKNKLTGIDWKFHQFSERVRVTGINHRVDGNDYNGTIEQLRGMCFGGGMTNTGIVSTK